MIKLKLLRLNISWTKNLLLKTLAKLIAFWKIEIHHSAQGICVGQQKYIHDILSKSNMLDCNSRNIPVCVSSKLSKDDGVVLENPAKYRRLVSKLLYLIVTRPDIMFGAQQLSQFLDQPTNKHWKCLLRILRYLKGTQHYQLQFSSLKPLTLTAYSDSDWDYCLDSRKSITVYYVFLGDCLVF